MSGAGWAAEDSGPYGYALPAPGGAANQEHVSGERRQRDHVSHRRSRVFPPFNKQ